MTSHRHFRAGAGLAEKSLREFVTLQVEIGDDEISQLAQIDSAFKEPELDMEDELAHATSPSTNVVVDVRSTPPQLLLGGQPFLELPEQFLPAGWSASAAAVGVCFVLMGRGANARGIWAIVHP